MEETYKSTMFSSLLPGHKFVFKRSAFGQRYVKVDYNIYTTIGAHETFVGKLKLPESVSALTRVGRARVVEHDYEVLKITQPREKHAQ